MKKSGYNEPPTRRDFMSTCGLAAAGAICSGPLSARTASPRQPVIVDLAPIAVGQEITVAWNALPIIIRHRTQNEIDRARNGSVDTLVDRFARNALLAESAPATDDNRIRPGHPEWLVLVGICTHLGCRLASDEPATGGEDIGWFCPCHAARFDRAGRVLSGPARTNLSVPPYKFIAVNRIVIGTV
jgi:ubiquinol-cytochrome c reductase iron-sulfur subunit